MEELHKKLRLYVAPFVIPGIFTVLAVILPLHGQEIHGEKGRTLSLGSLIKIVTSIDEFALYTVCIYFIWALIWLKMPSKKAFGPTTTFKQTPVYQDNGVIYYCASVALMLIVYSVKPDWAVLAYKKMPELISLLCIMALVICALLAIKGIYFPAYKEITDAPKEKIFNIMYRFWCGSELHPKVWGVDIKQLIICRLGLMMWQHLIVAFLIASTYMNGFSLPFFYNVMLQSVYLLKFFMWEIGYFYTIDIIEDRASYYLCWGTLVWVPSFYTWSSYYLVNFHSSLTVFGSTVIFIAGLLSILLNYLVDLERQVFRRTGKSFMPGETKFMKVTYKDDSGKKHETTLLTSGFWGKARHLNYVFEISLTACWCLETYGTGAIEPYLYLYFLTILLVHRFYRDQERCRRKYGDKQWNAYCKLVPYKFIPYIV